MQSEQAHQFTNCIQSNELLCTLSPQGIFDSVSAGLMRETGWHESDWIGKALHTFIHPYDIAPIKDRFREILAGRSHHFDSIRCLSKNGDPIGWALSFVPQLEHGGVSKVLVLGHPIVGDTAQRPRTSHPLNTIKPHGEVGTPTTSTIVEYAGLAKLLEGMLGNAPVGFALLDERLRFICLNQAFAEMTGFSPAQQLGLPLRDLLPRVAALLEPAMQSVLSTGESVAEIDLELKDGEGFEPSRHAQMSLYPIPDLHGGICGVATIAVDTTARKRSEAALARASDELVRTNLALEEFSYVASHDLKEPLRTMSTFAGLLGQKYRGKLDPDADQYLSYVTGGAKRMQRLIDKILEYSRSGKAEADFSPVDCNLIVQTVLQDLEGCLDESHAEVSCDELPTVWGEHTLLFRVFQNLIANAIKYRGSSPPKIHISAKQALNVCVFSISDNGIGISESQFLNIFTPFKKLHAQSEYAGSGLGLAICRKNVERHGGTIWVTSQKNVGSTFSFTIPLLRKQESTNEPR